MTYRTLLIGSLAAAAMVVQSPSARAQQDAAQQAPAAEQSVDIGYFLGVSIGQDLARNGFQLEDFEFERFQKGLSDGISGKEPAMTREQLQQTQAKIQSLIGQRQQQESAAQMKKGQQFLAANAKKEGVKTLKNGLQYKVLESGDGASPSATDTVRVHYTGKLTSGEVFDSSVERGQPAEFPVNRVIPGWTMALQQMQVGDKWMLYIPPDLAYGEEGKPPIGPNEVLIFEVELLDIL